MKYDEVKQQVKEKLEKANHLLQIRGLDVITVVTSPFQLILLVMTGKCIIIAYKHRRLFLLIRPKILLSKYITPLMNGIGYN